MPALPQVAESHGIALECAKARCESLLSEPAALWAVLAVELVAALSRASVAMQVAQAAEAAEQAEQTA